MGKPTPYIQQIGPITSKLFSKVQILLDDCTESERYEVCFNMLVMLKQMDQEANSTNRRKEENK